MEFEFDALQLQHNRVWTLVLHPHGTNIVGSKWIFKTKFPSDGLLMFVSSPPEIG
jgi:hypothetical protein